MSGALSNLELDGPLEAVLLLKRNGVVLASWARKSVPAEVVTVMASTMVGSIETIVESLGCPVSQTVSIETDSCRLLSASVNSHSVLVLVARRAASESYLRHMAHEISHQLAGLQSGPEARPPRLGAR